MNKESRTPPRASILIVDDQPKNLLALGEMLEPLDLRIIKANSGEEALKKLLKHEIAVILLDVQMPGLDGFATAEEIKRRTKTRDIPIIFLTAISREPHQALRGYSAGAVDYLAKPLDPWILKAKVQLFVDLYEKNRMLVMQRELLETRLRKLEREITERKLAEAALRRKNSIVQLLQTVAAAANQEERIEDALQVALDAVCTYNGWPVGHAFLTSSDGNGPPIRSSEIWHLDDPERFAAFRKATEDTPEIKGLGPSERVLETRQPDWLMDVAQDPTFARAPEASAAGLKSAFAVPILAGREIVGVLEFFAHHVAVRDDALLEVTEPLASQLGRAIERRRVEEDLRNMDRAKSEFIGNAAHELRTPLSVITGVSQVLMDQFKDLDAEELAKTLTMMHRQSDRMRNLINNLLDITGFEFGRLQMDIEDVNLSDAVTHSVENIPAPEGRAIETKIPPRIKVKADKVRLDQVLTNLIDNAYKYGEGKVWIEAASRGGLVEIAVCNEGKGVPDDLISGLFDPFTRGQHTGATRGSGLGLTICRRIVEAFGGDIGYEANGTGGSRFQLTIPKAR